MNAPRARRQWERVLFPYLKVCLSGLRNTIGGKQMNGKIGMRAFSVLLTVLLVSVVLVPVVSAEEQTDALVDLDQYTIPDLKMDRSIETIAISGMLSLQEETDKAESGTYGIPSGSIVVHAADGITRVFDKDGDQLLSISDERSEKIPTPAGVEKPCTRVHQIPNDSRIYYRGDTIFVLNPAGELILLIINEDTASKPCPESTRGWTGHDWLESAEDYLNGITEYTAYWTVPSAPPSLEVGEMIYLFNVIQVETPSCYLLQPVIRYNPQQQRWEGQAWGCDPDGPDDFIGSTIVLSTGDTMKGRIYWDGVRSLWIVSLEDSTTGQSSVVTPDSVQPQSNCLVGCALEGWYVDDNTDVPGDTNFYSMSYKAYGIPMT
ncbi:MAG: hypothetical protein PWR21_874, partial [Methanoculleus sp.]|nr:hypothetical protein [Methanoculleus sp.]